jgi:hypothetical protein
MPAATSFVSGYFCVSNLSDRLSSGGDFEQHGHHSKPPGSGSQCDLREQKKTTERMVGAQDGDVEHVTLETSGIRTGGKSFRGDRNGHPNSI